MDSVNQANLAVDGRDVMDVYEDDRQEAERTIRNLQSQLRQSEQTIDSLSRLGSGDAGQKLADLASENSKLRDKLNSLFKSHELLKARKHEIRQEKDNEIADLKQKLCQMEQERNKYFQKNRQLGQRVSNESPSFCQNEGQSTTANSFYHQPRPSRVSQRLELNSQDPETNKLFSRCNEVIAEESSMVDQLVLAEKFVENQTKYQKRATDYQSNVNSLYTQLQSTAKFLAHIVHLIGADTSQVKLLMQKIEKLGFNTSEFNEFSERMVNESKQIAHELTTMSMQLEESIRQSMSMSRASLNVTHNTVAFDELVAKKNELIEQEELLMNEIAELKKMNDDLSSECNSFKDQVSELSSERNDFKNQVAALNTEMRELTDKYKGRIVALNNEKRELTTVYGEQVAAFDNEKRELKDKHRAQIALLNNEKRELTETHRAQVATFHNEKRELIMKYDDAVKFGEEQKTELDNREKIIKKLQSQAMGATKLPEDLGPRIEDHLLQVYNKLSDVKSKLNDTRR